MALHTPSNKPEAPVTQPKTEAPISTRPPYAQASRDTRALKILAKTIYREMRQGGLIEEDVMSIAGELLALVAGDMKDRRAACQEPPSVAPRAHR